MFAIALRKVCWVYQRYSRSLHVLNSCGLVQSTRRWITTIGELYLLVRVEVWRAGSLERRNRVHVNAHTLNSCYQAGAFEKHVNSQSLLVQQRIITSFLPLVDYRT